MYGYFFTGFIDFMTKDESLLDYTNSFSPIEDEKNGKIIMKCFQQLETKPDYSRSRVCATSLSILDSCILTFP